MGGYESEFPVRSMPPAPSFSPPPVFYGNSERADRRWVHFAGKSKNKGLVQPDPSAVLLEEFFQFEGHFGRQAGKREQRRQKKRDEFQQ